jgi:hypothetical protein
LHKFHWSPGEFIALSREEKAFVAAAVQMKVKQDEEESKKIKAKSGRKRR